MKKAVILALAALAPAFAADKGVTLIGVGEVPGNSLDLSGLKGNICAREDSTNCIPRATFGGFGSGLTYTGHDNVFLAVPDRGPFDGRTTEGNPYLNRFDIMYMKVDPSAPFPNIKTVLLDTRFLKNEINKTFVGDAYSFNTTNALQSLRLDPEGIRMGLLGTFFVSDEYGPYLFEFEPLTGHLLRRLHVPAKFAIAHPTGDVDSAGNSFELYTTAQNPAGNDSGRQANRGMEGLAITPDSRYLVGIMQNALIQDHGLDGKQPPGRVGLNNRILRIDLLTGRTQEFVYTIDGIQQGRGVNEMLAINDHQFLVLERDNRTLVPTPPATAAAPILKRVYMIDLNKPGLTDVSNVASLPASGADLAAANIVAVDKTLFLDLLDPDYKINATTAIKDVIAEKIEGLAWGPDLQDGRHVLFVASDNDLNLTLPTKIYAFAINEKTAGVDVQQQWLPVPIYPSFLVNRAVK